MTTVTKWGRALVAALLIGAAPAWAAQTGTAQTQAALYDAFCDQCLTSNLSIRNLIASVVLGPGALSGVQSIGFSQTLGGTPDAVLVWDAAGVIGQRSGTTSQAFKIYNTFTDASNYERLSFQFVSNDPTIFAQSAGTGTQRNLRFRAGAASTWMVAATSGDFLAVTDNANDIGAAGATRPRSIYVGTSVTSPSYLTGASGSATIQFGATANDTVSVAATTGTLAGMNNSSGLKFQLISTTTGGVRVASDSVLGFNSTTTLASGAIDTGLARNGAGIVEANNGTAGTLAGMRAATYATGAPRTIAAATDTVLGTDSYLIANNAGTVTLTLLAAASFTGRSLTVKTIQAQTVVSATSNVVPRAGGAAGTAILAGTAGNWATLVSDGTNWILMAGSP